MSTMPTGRPGLRLLGAGAALLLVLALGAYRANLAGVGLSSEPAVIGPQELRGAWVQEKSIRNRAAVERMLDRAEASGLNAIFVCVFVEGQPMYESALVAMSQRVKAGFNPLAYLVPEAHRRGIAVHAWFIVGMLGDAQSSPILGAHPEWALVGPDGKTTNWLNFTRPDVRQFVGDLMLEVVERYAVDGVHFDYTRYPGSEWGFDSYSVELFNSEHQFDLNRLRYADLPAYGSFDGNPLLEPRTAQVLAAFSDGMPAVTLNRFGEGEALLMNWNASERHIAAGSVILSRSLERMLDEGGTVYLLRSATNAEVYGYADLARTRTWLDQLGWATQELSEERIGELGAAAVLVLPNVYHIRPELADQLAEFVRGGGGVIFIDGPTRSIWIDSLQQVTGMAARGRYFNKRLMMVAAAEHALIPSTGLEPDLATYEQWDARWKAFRRRGISELISTIYGRVKAVDPEVIVSVTVTSDQRQAADENMQDWAAWLEGNYIDLLIPRGYVDEVRHLDTVIVDWQQVLQRDERVTLGLKVFTGDGKAALAKSANQVLTEIYLAHNSGSNGVMLFDFNRVSDEQLRALAAGPFAPSEGQD